MTDHRITTTMRPGEMITVDDAGFTDLVRMGVVSSEVPYSLADVPEPTPLVSSMQAGGSLQEVDDGGKQGQELQADGGQTAAATGQ